MFTVTLSNTSSRQITVRYATSDGTATSPADYTSTNGTLTIAAQTSSITITVPTVNDTIDESNETFTITLTSPQNATVSDGQGAGTITDNDGVPTLSIDDVTVPEGTSAVFTVTLSNTSSRQITVRYATSDGTATSPADYTSTNGTLTIAAQTSSVTITVPTVNDTIDESNETFTITLTSPQNATVSDGQGAGTITDDGNGTPTPSIDAVDDSVNTYANTPVIIHVRNNDQGIEGFPLNVISVTDPPNGKAQINSDNTITYTPNSGYEDVDSFTYTISANGSTDTATVTVSVLPAFIPRINCVNQNVLPVFGRTMIKNSLDALTWRLDNVFSETSTRTGIFRMEQQAQLHEALKKNIFDEREDWSSLDLEETLYGSSLILEAGVMIKKPKKDENMWIDEEDKPLVVERDGQIGFWGKADYNSFSVDGNECSTGKGDMASGYLGVDRWLSSDVLTGISLSLSRGNFEYESRVQEQLGRGNYYINILSASPYIGWFISEGTYFWTMFSYGRGEVDVNDDEAPDTVSSDVNYKSVALGIRSRLFNIGDTVVSLRSEVFRGWVNSQGQDQIMEQLSVDIQQSRLGMEINYEYGLLSGVLFSPFIEFGLLHDRGDGQTGTGIEVAGGLLYENPVLGLSVSGRGRWLAAYSSQEIKQWGIGWVLTFDKGTDGLGTSFSVAPVWGETSSGTENLWERSIEELSSRESMDTNMNLDVEFGYGLPVLGGEGILTPYGIFSLGASTQRQYRLGNRLDLGSSTSLSLEGMLRQSATTETEHGIALKGTLRF